MLRLYEYLFLVGSLFKLQEKPQRITELQVVQVWREILSAY
jgi:hypothetical protein